MIDISTKYHHSSSRKLPEHKALRCQRQVIVRDPWDFIRIKNLENRIKNFKFSFLDSIILILFSILWIPAFAGMTGTDNFRNNENEHKGKGSLP